MIQEALAAVRAAAVGAAESAEGNDVAVLTTLATLIDGLGETNPMQSELHPAIENWLEPALALADESTAQLAETLRLIAPHIAWSSSYKHLAGDPRTAKMDQHYCYGVVAGPTTSYFPPPLFATDELLLCYTVQGPDVFYPEHRHSATEIYGTIGGTADWLRDETWIPRPPGSVFVHDDWMMHATRTAAQPIVNWVAWVSDVTTSSAEMAWERNEEDGAAG